MATSHMAAVEALEAKARRDQEALKLADALVKLMPDTHRRFRMDGMHRTDESDWDRDDYGYENCQEDLCVAARAYSAARTP